MAYNLNYNPGVDHERSLKRRKLIIIWVIVLVVIALAAVIILGILYTRKNNNPAVSGTITDEQRADLINRMSSNSTATTQVFTKEEKQLSQDSSAKSDSSGESSVSQSEKDKLLESMSGH